MFWQEIILSLFGQIKTERKRVENFFRSSNFISDINWPKIKAVDVIDSHLDCFNNKCHYYPFRGQRTKDRPNMNGHGQKVFGSHDFGLGYRFGLMLGHGNFRKTRARD